MRFGAVIGAGCAAAFLCGGLFTLCGCEIGDIRGHRFLLLLSAWALPMLWGFLMLV
jgi:hypothetical protein